MIRKYLTPWEIILFLVMSALKSFQIVFIAYMFQQFINFAQKPKNGILNLTLFAVSGLILFGIIGILYQYLYANLITKINLKVKKQIIDYLVYMRNKKVKIDTSFMTNDLKQLETNKAEAELEICYNSIQFIAAVVSAFVSSWLLSVIFLLASFAPALLQNIFGSKIEKESRLWEKENSKYTESVNETINGLKIASLYNAQTSFIKLLLTNAKQMEYALKHTNEIKNFATEVTTTFAYICGMIIPFSFGIYFVTQNEITLGTFMMIAQLANNFINPVVVIFSYINDMKTAKPIWNKVKDIENIKIKKNNKNDMKPTFKGLQLINAEAKINNHIIFNNINLKVENGEKLLLQAPSGWGKSTLLKVLTGDLALTNGEYSFNRQEVNGDWDKLHNYFSYVQQKPFILDNTLKYNITLGKDVDQSWLNEVAQLTEIMDIVKEKGWSYKVGPNGKNLSGGQNQRIEIARALLTKRPILIADEATASLDNKLSNKIHQTLLRNYQGTVIEVAHKIEPEERKLFTNSVNLAKMAK